MAFACPLHKEELLPEVKPDWIAAAACGACEIEVHDYSAIAGGASGDEEGVGACRGTAQAQECVEPGSAAQAKARAT